MVEPSGVRPGSFSAVRTSAIFPSFPKNLAALPGSSHIYLD